MTYLAAKLECEDHDFILPPLSERILKILMVNWLGSASVSQTPVCVCLKQGFLKSSSSEIAVTLPALKLLSVYVGRIQDNVVIVGSTEVCFLFHGC